MTSDELIQIADDYYDTAAKKKEIDAQMKILKSNIVTELEKTEYKQFDFGNGLKATKQSRVGTVDIKAIQIKYNISDAELDEFRKPSSESWVFKIK